MTMRIIRRLQQHGRILPIDISSHDQNTHFLQNVALIQIGRQIQFDRMFQIDLDSVSVQIFYKEAKDFICDVRDGDFTLHGFTHSAAEHGGEVFASFG